MRIVIVRDREAAGGGIHNYYCAVCRHLSVSHELLDVGRSHAFHIEIGLRRPWELPTALRLCLDWAMLLMNLCRLPNLVHLNPCLDPVELRSLPRDAVSLFLAKVFRRKVLVFWRGWDNEVCGAPEFPGGNGGWLSRVYRLADAHIVLADEFRNDLRRWGFKQPIHLETTVAGDAMFEAQSKLITSEEDGRFKVLYLSRVEVFKGVFEMLDSFALLEGRDPERYHFTIAGDGPALAELKRRARELNLKNIEFKGYLDGEAKSACYAAADGFCFLSYTEGMPNAVLEAMAMGLPLVSSAAGGLKDILEEGLTGYLVRYDQNAEIGRRFSAQEVANRIQRLATEPGTRRRMADHNRRYASERFAAKRVAARLEAIYREMLGAPIALDQGMPESVV